MRHYPAREPKNPAGHWSPRRDRATQARFRNVLLKRSGGHCEHPGCITPLDRLQAHHDKAGYTADCGRLLCHTHHKQADPHAR